ncbi:MAG: AAA family ATPase [Actinomycetota bacterium]|nr:AAA family ATPase [Actinomycetota bacterium]
MADLGITLPDGTQLAGGVPIVIVGPNGSGKTRLAHKLSPQAGAPIEFINALRSTRISAQLPAMSRVQAVQQHNSQKDNARTQPWELISDFDFVLAQLLVDDGDAARTFRRAYESGQPVDGIEPSALQLVESLWRSIFPGRMLEWKDWAPVVRNDRAEVDAYGANEMSDGERAALYLLSKVLLSQLGTILVIDEPETHFHEELAVRLWDALEKARPDLRFVYVTHDIPFALSREPAAYLLADPISGLTRINIYARIPANIRRAILGAASFSYYASRVIFCEGEDHSFDKAFLSAWCPGRDTVVLAVGSGDVVRQCVDVFKSANLVDNLEALGVVDRDFRSDDELKSLAATAVVLPVHEIEGLVCLPAIGDRLATHLGKTLEGGVAGIVQGTVRDEDVRRVAYERTKLGLLNSVEDLVTGKPGAWDEKGMQAHYDEMKSSLGRSVDAVAIFKEELSRAEATRKSGDIAKILEIFPSKPIANAVARTLGVKVSTLFEIVIGGLAATVNPDDPLYKLGSDLEAELTKIGLPPRTVTERRQEPSSDGADTQPS